MRQGESNIFQISTWKAFLLYIWKPVWICACPIVLLVNLQQPAIVRLNVSTSDCESRTFFIMNFLNFLRWKSIRTTGIPMLNYSINRYGNPNITRGYFGGKSHSHRRLVKQRQQRVNKDENRKRKLFLYPCCLKY